MRLTFISSIALNLLLLTTLVAARVDPARVTAHGGTEIELSLSGSAPVADVAGIETAAELVRVLSRMQLETDDVRALTLSWLENEIAAVPAAPPTPYWLPGFSPALNELVSKTMREARARNELITIFGTDAVSDPAFARVFFPLGDGFAFLGSQAQIALQQHQIERLKSSSVTAGRGPSPVGCVAPAGPRANPRLDAPVPVNFSAADAFEYRLRYSPLADQLRSSAGAVDEEEYRVLFDLLLQLESQVAPEDQVRLRHVLRSRMGGQAFDRLQSMRDPLFVRYQTFIRGQGFGEAEAQAAYAILNQAQEDLLEVISRDLAGEGAVRTLGRIRDRERQRLTGVLGETAARELLLVRNRAVSEQAALSLPDC